MVFSVAEMLSPPLAMKPRQLILLVLLASDLSGIRVGEIAEKAHLTRPSVSHHLQILKNSGIVSMRKEGTKNYYSLSIDGTQWKNMSALINLIYEGVQRIETREYSKQKEKDA